MDTGIKHPVPDRVKPSFVIFWHPGTLTLSPERQSSGRQRVNWCSRSSMDVVRRINSSSILRRRRSGWSSFSALLLLQFSRCVLLFLARRLPISLPVVGRQIWNSLPHDITSAPSLQLFHNRLKTHHFITSSLSGRHCQLTDSSVLRFFPVLCGPWTLWYHVYLRDYT